jgi:HEPN domain
MNRTDLQHLAEEWLTDARLLLANGRFGAARYLAGYAIECALKACIAKLTKAEDFPIKDSKQTVYIHNLTKLAQAAGISDVVREVHQPGPLEAYMQIQQAMGALDGLSLSLDDIIVIGPRSTAFRELRKTIEGVSQMSVSGKRVSLEGAAHEDAYIYRWSYD